jgi:hypothetical protein
MWIARTGILASSGGALYDVDAAAFLTATGITNITIQNAVTTLVKDLKGYGVWAKYSAIYPMVGGTAFTHKFNLKDPRDLNAAFRLQFVNGWTHSSTGAKGDGAGGHAYTFFNPSLHGLLNSHHSSFYSRTNQQLNTVELGVVNYPDYNTLNINGASNSTLSITNQSAVNAFPNFTDTNSIGYYIGNRNASNSTNIWKNGIKKNSTTSSSSFLLNGIMYLSATNNLFGGGSVGSYSAKECAFATIGQGLSDTEASNVSLAVQKFQTALSRNV